MKIEVNHEIINLLTLLFCDKVATRSEVRIDLNRIIEAINVHILEHGVDENYSFDPKSNIIEQTLHNIKNEQDRCMQDLLNFNKRYYDFTNNYNATKDLLNNTINEMQCINETVNNLERLRIEKQRREEELIKDSNSEATTFEQLTIKVQLLSKAMQNEVANKSWVESLLDAKLSELDKKFEKNLNATKSELEAKIKETNKNLSNKISNLDKKINEEANEQRNSMNKLQEKFNTMSTEINTQIK